MIKQLFNDNKELTERLKKIINLTLVNIIAVDQYVFEGISLVIE